jgi:hypothetical protein
VAGQIEQFVEKCRQAGTKAAPFNRLSQTEAPECRLLWAMRALGEHPPTRSRKDI